MSPIVIREYPSDTRRLRVARMIASSSAASRGRPPGRDSFMAPEPSNTVTGMGRNGTVDRDLTYATVDGVDLRLDLYRAEPPASTTADGASPVVVYVHGGGWTHGDRTAEAETRLAPMAAQGVT